MGLFRGMRQPAPVRSNGQRFPFSLVLIAVLVVALGRPEGALATTHIGSTTYTANTTWNLAGSPYVIDGNVTVSSGVTLTIDPGVIVKFNGTVRQLIVNGTLSANGTSSSPITFTSYQDDSVGGDTNGDGTATHGDTGQWLSISLSGSASSATLNNVVVSYGGYGFSNSGGGEVSVTNSANATVTNSTIKQSMTSGIYEYNGSTVTLDGTAVKNNGNGISITGATATIKNRTLITNNSQDGLWVSLQNNFSGATTTVNASDLANNGRYGAYLNINGDAPLGIVPHGNFNNINGNTSGQLTFNGSPAFKNANIGWKNDYWGNNAYDVFNDLQCRATAPNANASVGFRGTGTPPSSGPISGGTYAAGQVPNQVLCRYDSIRLEPTEIMPAPLWTTGGIAIAASETLGGAGFTRSIVNPTDIQADPVNGATGNATSHGSDLRLPGIGVPFQLTRTYNSLDSSAGPLGPGWTFSYNASLSIAANGDATFRSDTGQQLLLSKQQDGSFISAAGGRATLASIQGGYELIDHDQLHLRFDTGGKLTSVKDRNGQGLTMAYTGGQLSSITDSANRAITFTYSSGLLTQVSLPDGRHVTYGFTNGLLTSYTDARGKTTTYTYDAHNWLASETDPNNHRIFLNTYGNDGRVTEQVDALGHHTTFAWDQPTQTATLTDARGHAWKDVYSNGVLIKQIDPLNNTTIYGYGSDLNVTSITDPRGNTTTMTYDSRGNLLTETAPSPLSYQKVFTYDSQNNVLTARDGRGNTTSYAYNAAGDLTSITRPGSVVTQFGVNSLGLVTSVTDPRGKVTQVDYDSPGNLTAITTPLGNKTTFFYDSSGRMTSTVDPRGNVTGANPDTYRTTYTYNENDQPLTVTDPLAHIVNYAYDDAGNPTSFTDATSHVTSYGYDAANELTSVTAPGSAATAYAYDANGNVTSRTDANNHATTYAYDDANRLTSATNPLSKTWSIGYDANGNRTSLTKPSTGSITVSYDVLNRPTGLTFSDSTPSVTYSYDGNSNRTQLTDGAGTETATYDALNRVKAIARGTDSFGCDYDAAGDVTLRTYPDGTSITYGYDNDGRLSTVTRSGNTATYGYDVAGNPTQLALPNGAAETRTYDAAGRLTEVKHTVSQTTLAQFDYAYDADNNPTTVTTPTGVTTYGYDNRDRLTSVCYQTSCPGGSDPFIRWTYDAVGNRLTEARPSGTTNYTYDAADELTHAGSTNYTYDANGNETQAGTRTFAWNIASQLTSTTNAGSTTSYSYDGLGNRRQASSASQTTNYLWDENWGLPQLAVERNGSGSTLRSYTYGLAPLSMLTGGQNYYFHTDGSGSVVNLTASSGQTEWTYSYEPFGNARTETKNDTMAPDNVLRFSGELLDTDSGLYDLRARNYDTVSGRFLTLDPRPAQQNDPYASSYTYVGDAPTVYADPSGRGRARNQIPGATAIPRFTVPLYSPLDKINAILNSSCQPTEDELPKQLPAALLPYWIDGWVMECLKEKAMLRAELASQSGHGGFCGGASKWLITGTAVAFGSLLIGTAVPAFIGIGPEFVAAEQMGEVGLLARGDAFVGRLWQVGKMAVGAASSAGGGVCAAA